MTLTRTPNLPPPARSGGLPPRPGPLAIRSSGIARDPASQAYLHERIAAKLGKFARHLERVEVRVAPLGPAGDPARVACTLSVTLDGGGRVAVQRSAQAAREALDHATGAAERMLRRMFQRLRHR